MPLREARLRPEWRELYPALRIEWETAAVLADRLLADSLLRGSGMAIQGRCCWMTTSSFAAEQSMAVNGSACGHGSNRPR
ncbi:MAG: hypothetical protein ACREA0_09950 [bacterium]